MRPFEQGTYGTIFDIGANNGDDAEFYLRKGFSVVAVEANPALCSQLGIRFAAALLEGRLVIENVGVSDRPDKLELFVNTDWSDWSSFVSGGKATSGNFSKVMIDTVPMSALLDKYGPAYYVKIDIEGFERRALSTLGDARNQPRYVSWEVNSEWERCLTLVHAAGCTGYKLVRQGKRFLPPPPQPAREGLDVAIEFNDHMSGTFGEDTSGEWVDLAEMKRRIEDELAERKQRVARGEKPGWHDVHCRFF